MPFLRKHAKLIGVAVSCAALGAGISAIATAGASTPTHSLGASRYARLHGGRRLLARAVHGDAVVATRNGFATVTFDRGTVSSVNGQQLTLADGTKKATYKTVVLTIPTAARVRDDGQLTTLSSVKPGQRAIVVQGPKRTLVIAHTVR